MKLKRNRNSVFKIGYHIIWCTKYRKPILVGEIELAVNTLIQRIAKEHQFDIIKIEIMSDHINLFIEATPNHRITDMIKALKGVTARFLFKDYPELKKQLYGGHLWNPSYYVGTVGDISEDVVLKYIESQKIKEKQVG